MWSKEDVIISLACGEVHKYTLSKYVRLDKPWKRYKREEIAEIISKESETNVDLLNLLQHKREQRVARDELERLYLKEQNDLPYQSLDPKKPDDWVKRLDDYKNDTELRSKKYNPAWR